MNRIRRVCRCPAGIGSLAIAATLVAVSFTGWTSSAGALTIVPVFDSSITNLPNAAQYQSGINTAISEIDNRFADPITIHIAFTADPSPSVLAGSSANLVGFLDYAGLTSALVADAKTANDATAISHFGADPTHGGQFYLTVANAAALGFGNFESSTADGLSGTVSFGSSQSYSFDPNNRAVPGKFDFIGAAEHEITEVMGRINELGADFGGGSAYLPYDIFRYTGNGTTSVAPGDTSVYFSLDGGETLLKFYNGPGGGDLGDWASGFGPDAFNAFAGPGDSLPLTAVGLQVLDAIGYDLVPEPSSFLLCGLGDFPLFLIFWQSCRRAPISRAV